MFFAVNPWSDELVPALLHDVAEAQSAWPSCHVVVLLDLAFGETFFSEWPWRRMRRHNVYQAGPLAELSRVGLCMLELSDVASNHADALHLLKGRVNHKPMFSLLISALAPDMLAQSWQPFLLARTDDGLEWPVRWGDSRVVPHLLDAMTDAERTHFLAPLYAWLSVGRGGNLMRWVGGGDHTALPRDNSIWTLDEDRFHRLIELAEADALLSRIDEVRPDLLRHQTPLASHRGVTQCLSLADRGGIQSAPDRLALSMIGLGLDDAFMQHPAFELLLRNTQSGARFTQEVTALPDEFWRACARRHVMA